MLATGSEAIRCLSNVLGSPSPDPSRSAKDQRHQTQQPTSIIVKKLTLLNLAFWIAAIGFPVFARSLPTGSGAPPKIYDVLIPLIQMMLAFGSTFLVNQASKSRSGS